MTAFKTAVMTIPESS